MKNITCWAFRNSINGPNHSYTEMINLKSLLSKQPKAWKAVDTYFINDQKQWVQILTHDPKAITAFPEHLMQFTNDNPSINNIYGVNINACCPDPQVIAAGDGAALIKRTKRLIDLINCFLGESNSHLFKVSIKFRLAINELEMGFNKIMDFLNELQYIKDDRVSPPIFHFRHARQASNEKPYWEFLNDFLTANIPIIINGSISNPQDLNSIISDLNVKSKEMWNKLIKGVMIGRASIKNPFCFRSFIGKNPWDIVLWKKNFLKNIKSHPPENRFIQTLQNYKII